MLITENMQSWAHGNFIALRQRKGDNVIEPQGPEKNQNIFRSRCLHGVATPDKVIWQ